MKSLSNYISEKLVINKNYKNDDKYFIYKLDKKVYLKIFDNTWSQFKDYKDKVYINDEHVELDSYGWTKDKYYYEPGTYKIEIKDLDNITNCLNMFHECWHLVKVPLFDTSKVKNMEGMFQCCNKLKKVPLFDTSKVTDMKNMFKECYKLSDETKQQWSKIYDFETDTKIK